MNIFVLHEDPITAAKHHCDKHVVKMILESAQLLCTAHREFSDDVPENFYKATHRNHPCAKWVRESKSNYLWVYGLLHGLSAEYTNRYGKVHLTYTKLGDSLAEIPEGIKNYVQTSFVQCMPDEYKDPDPVVAYRNYYRGDKAYMAQWQYSKIPTWWGER